MSIDQGRHALGVDFGTSNTVAVARWPDGRSRPILVDGSPLLPSAVYAEPGGLLTVGRDAVHSARRDPARFEPNPKRRIDDGLVLLGDREHEVVDLIAAVLVRVVEEWHRAVGPVRPDVTLTCPATWGATRRGLLAEAAARAGLESARMVAEPVAAATYFAEVLGQEVPVGSVVVVHDFGAGTFDASVVARTADGFEVLAVDGRDDLGGLDIDAALVEHLGTLCAERDPEAWRRLTEPETLEDRRAQRQLWDDARIAKERLSRTQSADVMIPLLDAELHVTRDELERLARPILDQTVQVTRDLLAWADLPAGRLAGVFLVGGASRIPLIATLLHRAMGEPPQVIEQPELVVAEGSLLADAALLATEPAAPGPTSEMRLVSRDTAGPAPDFFSGALAATPPSAPEPLPGLSAPDSAAQSASMRSSSASAEPFSGQSGSGVASGQSVTGLSASGQSVPGQPVSGQPGSGQLSSGQAAAGLPSGQAASGQLASGQPASGQLASGPGAAGHAGSGPGGAGHAGSGRPAPGRPSVDDMETVPRTRRDLTGAFPPAVDPWPDAEHDWEPDPDATVPSPISLIHPPSPAAAPVSPGARPSTGAQPGARPSTGAQPGAWPASGAQAAAPQSGAVSGSFSGSQRVPAHPTSSRPPASPSRAGVSPAGRAPAGGHPAARGSAAARGPAGAQGPSGARGSSDAGRQPGAAGGGRVRRRTGRGLRAVQVLLSLLLLVGAPVAALLAAYSYTSGVDLGSSLSSLVDDLAGFF